MEQYKTFAESFALKAGGIIKKNFSLGMSKEWKKDNSPVTQTDLEINSLLIEEVNNLFPTHSILAEEESDLHEGSEYVWVCDPVDGTIPFSHGIPICTFSLALTKNGESILGVVYDPFQERLFSATKDGGAYLNNKIIYVSKMDKFKGAVAGYEMWGSSNFNITELANYLNLDLGVKMLKLNSYIYAAMLVAAGELAFSLFPGATAHDVATVKIIVEEAGGKVTNIYGEEQRYDQSIQGAIASNGILHDELVALAKQMVKPSKLDTK